jgi:hypothetical protein
VLIRREERPFVAALLRMTGLAAIEPVLHVQRQRQLQNLYFSG